MLPAFDKLRITDSRLLPLIDRDGVGALARISIGNTLIAIFQDVGDGSRQVARFQSDQAQALFSDAVKCNHLREQLVASEQSPWYGAQPHEISDEDILVAYTEQAFRNKLTSFKTAEQNQKMRWLFNSLAAATLLINIGLSVFFTLNNEGTAHTALAIYCGAVLLIFLSMSHQFKRLNLTQTQKLDAALMGHPGISKQVTAAIEMGVEMNQANLEDIINACKRESQHAGCAPTGTASV